MMGWYGSGMNGVGWLFMGAFWLALVALIVWLVIRLLPRTSERRPDTVQDSPVKILDRRLASGEIDVDTYRDLRAALEGRKESTS